MNWTKTPPTEPGWYWHRENDHSDGNVIYIGGSPNGEKLLAYGWGTEYDERDISQLGGEWGGRVPAPGTTFTVEEVDKFLNTFSDYDEVSKVKEFLEYPVDGIAAVTAQHRKEQI